MCVRVLYVTANDLTSQRPVPWLLDFIALRSPLVAVGFWTLDFGLWSLDFGLHLKVGPEPVNRPRARGGVGVKHLLHGETKPQAASP